MSRRVNLPLPMKRAKATDQVSQRRINAILSRCRSSETKLIRFLYCGNDGLIRGKACHAEVLPSFLHSGIGLPVALQSFNMLEQLVPEGSFGPVGEVRLRADPETFVVLPYVPYTARVLCDLVTLDGDPWGPCPRSFRKRMIERGHRMGMELKAAFENEFVRARREDDRYVPFDRYGTYSTIGMDSAAPVVMDIIEALTAQGVPSEQYMPEIGAGQQELTVRFTDALRAADHQLTFRDTVRGVAMRHGLVASFAPKPFPDQPGNSAHIHFSLRRTRDGKNAFYSDDGHHSLSELGHSFIAGVLAHLPALLALTAPTVNSYRRLQPRLWCSRYRLGSRQQGGRDQGPIEEAGSRDGVDEPRVQALRPVLQSVPGAGWGTGRGARRNRTQARSRGAARRGP